MSDERVCAAPWCGKALVRKDGETSQNFKQRQYCGRTCAAAHGGARHKRSGSKAFAIRLLSKVHRMQFE